MEQEKKQRISIRVWKEIEREREGKREETEN